MATSTGYRPYPWERLHRLSASEAQLADRAARWVPGALEARWPQAFEAFWASLVGMSFQVECLGFSTYGTGKFAAPAGDLVVTEFELPPVRSAGVVAVDSGLVEAWLNSAVGPTDESRRLAELDDRDRAVFCYLAIRAAEFMSERGAPPAVVATHRIAPSDAFSRLSRHQQVIEIDFVFSSKTATGLVRVYLPGALMSSFDEWSARRVVPHPRLESLSVPVRASIGNVELTPIEIANLGEGDIVFPSVDPFGHEPTGAVLVGRQAVDASVAVVEDCWHLTICHDNQGRTHMKDNQASPDEATSQLAQAVDLRLDFVVGDSSLTIAELSRLQPGRVFVLDRAVGEPIDLVVNDHVVAKGELVDVDGRVGVRIVAIAGR